MLKQLLQRLFGTTPDNTKSAFSHSTSSVNPPTKVKVIRNTLLNFSDEDTNLRRKSTDSHATYLTRCCFSAIILSDRKILTDLLDQEISQLAYDELNRYRKVASC